ncbi:hypothetical protein AUEXF2481DRAFT_32445 [Aureobasidium subglaciale EXF-2481]|uniref:Uncharacterized protein n=1 Tax=Aureobasidium subglaciale (strain EXF-2481) TaxID=1043005 RepID=A0A074YDT1_AURSE|nr:uncharacterized protein AUEXF2481DRAFT_32445 [Aureobasidium subglaciale EXF-2481]KAI5208063.1 hypothetical protein E4T38_03053 [Aureobasidium subglaciale]KAI5226854.1 hypothetical protein E4T40_02827 [Aureobasidium subglaciale]KAI5230056.1 hypothetical protein E4T41_03050 [Aureobasidium subglaciale]KAI5264735.1 hypothetical protein E4T46_02828 [Aureobasidium subglaciale]KEQ92247.1 hypothetical protein AUEXF2481DRAFT_32445 [Aureobasidium subglaciale EXF-2481]
MAQARAAGSVAGAGASPHSISLKVLRLSHPSLSPAHTLPGDDLIARASLPYPAAPNDAFPLSPLLALPPAFGAAYVGTVFSCTLCANNELPPSSPIVVRDVQLSAELQVPSGSIALDLEGPDTVEGQDTQPAQTLQRIVRHELREDGPHVLAVTVTYQETRDDATNKRTFRKLYQFVAQPALGVRTKVGDLAARKDVPNARRFVLEAQLENLTETPIVLEKAIVSTAQGLTSKSLNWTATDENPILSPQDVMQVAFTFEQTQGEDLDEKNGRTVLAQLHVDWRSPMGEKGSLTTGWLGSRAR